MHSQLGCEGQSSMVVVRCCRYGATVRSTGDPWSQEVWPGANAGSSELESNVLWCRWFFYSRPQNTTLPRNLPGITFRSLCFPPLSCNSCNVTSCYRRPLGKEDIQAGPQMSQSFLVAAADRASRAGTGAAPAASSLFFTKGDASLHLGPLGLSRHAESPPRTRLACG